MAERDGRLSACVVGCRMGSGHAGCFAALPEYRLAGVCDLSEETAKKCAERCGNPPVFTDYAAMLSEVKPDVVAVATPNNSHAALTLQALDAGVKGICCEKPMAVHLADGRRMVEACAARKVPLIVNHQRRMGADLIFLRSLIESGVLGDVRTMRGVCAGDILSDGTHLIDSLMWLSGDQQAQWVMGQVHRAPKEDRKETSSATDGFRYGHVVESGGTAVVRLASGLRLEIACGDLIPDCRAYQDYEVVGSKATVWRVGDQVGRNLFISDGKPGTHVVGVDERKWPLKPVPSADGVGPWRPLSLPDDPRQNAGENAMMASYRLFADTIRKGTRHPMSGENALRGFEVISAIYESARTRRKQSLPLAQDRFALEIMVEQGQL